MSRVHVTWMPSEADYVAERRRVHRVRQLVLLAVAMAAAGVLPSALLGSEAPPVWLTAWGSVGLSVLVGLGVWRIPSVRVRRAMQDTPELYPTDPVLLEADAGGLLRRASTWEVTLGWDAVERIVVGRDHVFLQLSDVQVVAVPRAALGTPGDEARVLDQLRTWQERGQGAVLPPAEPDPGRDEWIQRYRLHAEDWILSVRKVQARRLGSRPILLALGVLLPVLLITAQEPWRGDFDPLQLSMMVAFGAAFVLLGALQWWLPALVPMLVRRGSRRHQRRMPVGEVVLGAGPEGGWLQTTRGISRFRWAGLIDVVNDADGVLLLFSEEVGVPVPERAFERSESQDAFVADVRRWRSAPASRVRIEQERRDRVDGLDAFSPPEEH